MEKVTKIPIFHLFIWSFSREIAFYNDVFVLEWPLSNAARMIAFHCWRPSDYLPVDRIPLLYMETLKTMQ